jgi:hypothetical protein
VAGRDIGQAISVAAFPKSGHRNRRNRADTEVCLRLRGGRSESIHLGLASAFFMVERYGAVFIAYHTPRCTPRPC